jgi:hypothetical protein
VNKQDCRDWVILGLVTGGWAAATLFLFTHPAPMNFATWSGVVATICGVYHFLTVSDDKRADAGNVLAVIPAMVAGAADRNWQTEERYAGTT